MDQSGFYCGFIPDWSNFHAVPKLLPPRDFLSLALCVVFDQSSSNVCLPFFIHSLLPSFHPFPCSRFLFQTITPGQSKGTSQTEWQVMTPSERLSFPRVHHCPNQDACIITLMSLPLSVPLYLSFIALYFLTVRYWTSILLHPCLWWIVIWLIEGGNQLNRLRAIWQHQNQFYQVLCDVMTTGFATAAEIASP